ncbi:MAG TPA: thiolase family protein [Candidatus Omnitrophota bacterium]|nr:thiolase family protein [Candidatus Omnitrophota bacterium]
MSRIAVVDGIRTPFCKMGTDFNDLSAQELGRLAARELLERTGFDPHDLSEVIFGCVGQPADAANISRVVALMAGVPKEVPAYTVHRNCASGVESAVQAFMKIQVGEGDCYLVGGTESMSNIPVYLAKSLQDQYMGLPRAKTFGQKVGSILKFYSKYLNFQKNLRVGLQLGLTDPVCGLLMGGTAEVLVKEFGITRRQQDEFALLSHQRAIAAKKILREEIMPIIPGPKYKAAVQDDNGPREGQTMEALAKLKPYFERGTGSVTVGNSSQVTDGAAALLIMSDEKARSLGYKPLGFIKSYAFAGVEPDRMGIGPAHAIPKALKKAQLKLRDMKAVEINEAFAAQVLACLKALASDDFAKKFGYEGFTGEINREILNVNGGAIALGHPVGTSGTRLILTMLKHMNRQNLDFGLVSLCVGGGQGAAVVLER